MSSAYCDTFAPCMKINSKCFKDLNISQDTIKLLEENIGKTFSDINHKNVFLGQSPKAIEIKVKISQWNPNQTYKLLQSKGNHKLKKKKNLWNGRKIFANDATDKGLISKYANNSHNSTAKKKKKN